MRFKHAGVPCVLGLFALVVGLGQATPFGVGGPETPLVEAANRGDAAAVHTFLRTGADVKAREDDGTTLGHCEVAALIGEGGMGQVYQAWDTKLDRDVTLKVAHRAL